MNDIATRQATLAALVKAAEGETWAEDDPQLPRIEARTIGGQLALWRSLERRALDALGLGKASWVWSAAEHLEGLLQLEQAFILASSGPDAPLVQGMFAAWLRGIANAKADANAVATVLDEARTRYRLFVQRRGLEMVRTVTARTYRRGIVEALQGGEYDGMNPREVARLLRRKFGAAEYDWERLARSELAMAQVDGKKAEYAEAGIERVSYVTANDSRVSAICRSLAAASPYGLAEAPVPVRDSHPNCRCTIRPIL